MSTITTLNSGDSGPVSRGVLNTNLANLNADKIETSVLDTDVALTANSDAKVATQKAVKSYVDARVGDKATVRAYKSGATQQIDTAFEKVLFESESYDVGGDFASSTFTAPRTGYYLITANGEGDSNNTDQDRAVTIAIYKDGTIYSQCSNYKVDATSIANGINITDTLYLTAGQTVDIYAKIDTGSVDFFTGEQYTFVTIREF